MLCEDCHENEACVLVLASVNGEKITRHLCMDCMKKQRMEMMQGNIAQFLSTLLAGHLQPVPVQEKKPVQEKVREDLGKTCPGCGMKLLEYRKTGLLGCPECYRTFSEMIENQIQKLCGTSVSLREGTVLNVHLEQLQEELTQAVRDERYEDAARLRDEMKALIFSTEGKA